ncbi:LysE/ArgO family amino acid transporter [Magnetovibrio sp.]|uniref:LysE/ArgO family amino acid transporter n=1 Tax=Magnetovibrio sp. TaxID=2024836 RepID=UPI002F94A3E2
MTTALFAQGLGLGAGLIIAIGSQNAFVLRQGLKHEHHFAIATLCFAIDAALITLGGLGVGTLVASTPALATGAAVFGALFLFVYGLLAFRRAWVGEALKTENGEKVRMSLKAALLTALGFSLLNPHVYLDTVVLLGGISGQHPWPDRAWFLTGAVSASLMWFYALAFAATKLAPLFRAPVTWKILDAAIGVVMWSIAISLLKPMIS